MGLEYLGSDERSSHLFTDECVLHVAESGAVAAVRVDVTGNEQVPQALRLRH